MDLGYYQENGGGEDQQEGIGQRGSWPPIPVPLSVGPALGYWVKEGVGLVVHFPLEDVAKINTP
jgi:hypothetical protein